MTSRNLWNLALFVAVASCGGAVKDTDSGGVDGDADTDADTDSDSTPTGDTSPPDPGFFNVRGFAIRAFFGWDNDTQTVVTPLDSTGVEIPPGILLTFGDQAWVDAQGGAGAACQILLPLTTAAPLPQWVVDDPQVSLGFAYLAADPPLTNCNAASGFEFDPAYGGEQGHLDAWSDPALEWGVGVGPLRPDAEVPGMAALATAAATAFGTDAGNVFGAIIHTKAFDGNPANVVLQGTLFYVALAHQVDATYTELPAFLTAAEVPVPSGGIATGSYEITTSALWYYQ